MEALWPDYDGDREAENRAEEEAEGGEEEEYDWGGEAVHQVLPLEVMQHIVSLADPVSVARSGCVCRVWRDVCDSDFVWEAVFRRHFSSRPSTNKAASWRQRCLAAVNSLRQLQSQADNKQRVWDIIKWCAACGFDQVLQDLLRKEGANVSLDLLNGEPPNTHPSLTPERTRPLHLAATIGCADVVEILALAGADVNVANHQGCTPVGIAAAKGFLDVVEVLLRHGAGGNDFARLVESQKGGRKGARPLSFQAAAGGHIKIMEVLMEKAGGPDAVVAMVNAAEPRTGKTALHFAAEGGHTGMVIFLLKRGADINALSKPKQSALHLATLNGRLSVVRVLLEHGAKIVWSASEANTKKALLSPLHLAAEQQNEDLVSLFLAVGLDINLADEHGADIKATDSSGQTTLHWALKSPSLEICRCLIEAGADVHHKDPVLHCVHWRDTDSTLELVSLFTKHGVDIRDPRLGTPFLAAAARSANYDLLVALLDMGIDPNAGGENDYLPLHHAVRGFYWHDKEERERVVKLLLERGADVNRHSGYAQESPLFHALDHDALFELLLAHGADVNARNGDGATLLYVTISWNWPYNEQQLDSMMKKVINLVERGADPRQCVRDGRGGPWRDVPDDPNNDVDNKWRAFLRSLSIPVETPEEEEEATGQEQVCAGENDVGEEGTAERVCDENEERDDDEAKGKEKLGDC